MIYIPTGKKPEFKYSIGDFVCYKNVIGLNEYYGRIELLFYEDSKPIYGIRRMEPLRDYPKLIKLIQFNVSDILDAAYEEDIF